MKKLFLAIVSLLLSACATCTASPQPLPVLRVPDCLGVNIHFAGRDQAQVDKIAGAGFGFIRMDFTWSIMEPKRGEYNFSSRDELMQTLEARGLRPIYILDYGNGLYENGRPLTTDEGRAALAAFAKAAAAHFKGRGVVWELWNEPTGGPERGGYSPEGYVKLAKAVYRAMKAADPDCVLLGPSLAGWNYAWFEDACKFGLLNYVDGISLHPYGAPKPEDVIEYYDTIRATISKYAPKNRHIPLISSEWGYPAFDGGGTQEAQAQYIVRSFLINMLQGCAISIWYDWRDDDRYTTPYEMEFHFGVLYNDYKEKNTYHSMKTLSTQLAGYSPSRRLETKSDNDYLMLFRKSNDFMMAAWTAGDAHTISIPIDAKTVSIVSLMGEKRNVAIKNGMLNINLTGSVQYIEPDTPSSRWAAEAAWNITGKVIYERGATLLKIESRLDSLSISGKLDVTGSGLENTAALLKQGKTRISQVYAWDGSTKPRVKASLNIKGINTPLTRSIELDTSEMPNIEVLPPVGRELLISVNRPTGLEKTFNGKLVIGAQEAIELASSSISFSLAPGQAKEIVHIKIKEQPKSVFSFACALLDSNGNKILQTPSKRYAIVETFSNGRPGEVIGGYDAKYSGDGSGYAKFTYAKAPKGSPFELCAKLDYILSTTYTKVIVSPLVPMQITDKPRHLKAWVMGDNNSGSTKLRIEDAGGQIFQPNYGFTNFTGWRCMQVDLTGTRSNHWGGKNDGHIEYPIKWNSIFVIESVAGSMKGAIHIGPMMLCYD